MVRWLRDFVAFPWSPWRYACILCAMSLGIAAVTFALLEVVDLAASAR